MRNLNFIKEISELTKLNYGKYFNFEFHRLCEYKKRSAVKDADNKRFRLKFLSNKSSTTNIIYGAVSVEPSEQLIVV